LPSFGFDFPVIGAAALLWNKIMFVWSAVLSTLWPTSSIMDSLWAGLTTSLSVLGNWLGIGANR